MALRQSTRWLAENVSSKPIPVKSSIALLPPIPLFRRILREHRHLPLEMRALGDPYVKDEFRRHRDTTNPVHIMGFLSQWKMYLDALAADPGGTFRGKPLDPVLFEKMSDEQLGQLYELMHASKDVWKPASGDSLEYDEELQKTKS
ncbi:uncharacterized protein EI90DRAFT_3028947 [Cantharellus anzutake]|uniref:uncharacterized protein n=1 Tax=Cantharellus anzutake TaxID=1750568 RepID=UPI00190350A7|nr:uncharacterized protein EI90DRAFT_3028947 [Cantharellus anzutake]KAF8344245.1 hypothetical protein EI90DRAFT_3028947 [Cantharellus anzutake]